jgi:hypothetical protein
MGENSHSPLAGEQTGELDTKLKFESSGSKWVWVCEQIKEAVL